MSFHVRRTLPTYYIPFFLLTTELVLRCPRVHLPAITASSLPHRGQLRYLAAAGSVAPSLNFGLKFWRDLQREDYLFRVHDLQTGPAPPRPLYVALKFNLRHPGVAV